MRQPYPHTTSELEDDRHTARLLFILIFAGLATLLIFGFIGWRQGDWRMVSATLAASALMAVPYWLTRHGRLRAASVFLVLSVLGTVTGLATIGQGIHDVGIIAFPIILTFASLTLDRPTFRVCVVLTVAALGWLAFGEAGGWYVPAPFADDPSNLVPFAGRTVLVLGAALAADLLATNARRSLGQARHEVAQRRQVEETLRESEQRYRNLVEMSPDAIAVHSQGKWVYANPAAVKLVGARHPQELVGQSILNVLDPDQLESRAPWEGHTADGKATSLDETKFVRFDGSAIDVDVVAIPLTYQGGAATQVIIRDITARKLAEQRALELALERQRVAILAKFIQDASHEFRTPLAIAQTKLYLLNRLEDPTKRKEALAQIGGQLTGIARLVDLLAEMARLDSGVSFTFSATDLNGLINEAVSKLKDPIAAAELTLHLALTLDLPPVNADSNRLESALHELLNNAVNHTPAGGDIIVRSSVVAAEVTVEVQDGGPGIAAEALPRIFERFYRQDLSHTTPGFGLGLPIAHAIVERHGGRIEVENPPGSGSIFRLVLPQPGVADPTTQR